MKKGLKISVITLLVFFLVLLVTPFLFKGKILEMAKKELNNMLTAKVDFSHLKLSFIRNFPNATVALNDLTVMGTDVFEGDTLLALKKFSVTVDIMSVIRMQHIEVKSVLLEKAVVSAHALENGQVNWDIMKPSDEAVVVQEDADPVAFKVALEKFEIRDANVTYRDDAGKMLATLKNVQYHLRGAMTQDDANLKMELGVGEVDFWMDGIRYLNRAHVGFVSEVAADLKNMGFTFKENRFNLNEIVLKFAGTVKMQADDIVVDVGFASEKADFKSLLSLVPAIYMRDYKSLKTTGGLTLDGDVKGTYNTKRMPDARLRLVVENAMFQYPDLPKSVNKVNINAKLFYDGEVFDRTTVDIDKLNFEMASNPFSAELHLKTPESDMQVAAKLVGKIDFNSIADIIPLDDVTLKGLLECDLSMAGRLSAFEKERYDDFKANGVLKLSGFDYESPEFPKGVKIMGTQLNFNPRKVDLVHFDATIGHSDIAMKGTLENFIPYVFKDETVRGTLSLKSNTLDLNELMASKTQTTPENSVPLSAIEVPKNIDFTINADIGTILFEKLHINNTVGTLLVKDGKVGMKNLAMNLLEGSVNLTGEYNTQNIKAPSIDFGMDIKKFDISSALSSFAILEKIVPNPQNYVGKVSAKLNLYSVLDENLNPDLNTITSKGELQTQNIEIQNSALFGALANLLKNESWRTPALGNIDVKYEIRDGRVMVEPIKMNISQAKVELSGEQGLDMSLNYKVNVVVPGVANIKEFKVTGLIGGTATKPNVSLGIADMAGALVESVKEQLTEKVDEAKEQLREELNKQIEAIMAEAEKQAEAIRNTAKETADKLRNEANATADKLVKEAESKSTVEKRLAQAAADKLRKEGEDKAVKLEEEANKQATAVLDAAKKRADEIRNQ